MDAPPPPPTSPAPSAISNPRYVYLLQRLRARQITMEEATELFALQQSMIPSPSSSSASSRAAAAGTPPATPAPPSAGVLSASADDLLWMTMLTMGAGAGLLAAVLKRSREGPKALPAK